MPGVGNQNVDCDGGLHEGVRLHLPQLNLGGTPILQCRSWIRLPLEKITEIRRRQYRQTKRVKFSISKKAPNRVIRCPACCSTRCCSMHKKKTFYNDGTKKGNGNLLERPRTRLPDELAIRRRRDAVRNLQRTDTEYDVANSKMQQRKWDSGFTQTRRKFSAMRAA